MLDVLFRRGPMSRAALGRELSLMRSTAGSLVAGLMRDGLVREHTEDAPDHSGRVGRPGVDVSLNSHHSTFLGADIGIGRITVLAIDLNADVIGRAVRAFDPAGADAASIVETTATMVERLLVDMPQAGPANGLAVSAAGLIDRSFNALRVPILGWSNLPLTAMLRARLPALSPILAENDANAFAMAEIYRAEPVSPQNALYMLLDVGVGGGLVAGGRMLRGHDGYAGEIGHMPVGDTGFSGTAALPGSLESFIGRDAVLSRDAFHGGSSHSIDEFLASLLAGSPSAKATLADWAWYLARGLAVLIPVFNPERIILGGPVAQLFPHADEAVDAALRAHMLPSQPRPSVALSVHGADGPALGAAFMLHRNRLSLNEAIIFNGARLREKPVLETWAGVEVLTGAPASGAEGARDGR